MIDRRGAERKQFTRFLDFKASAFESATVFCKGKALDISSQGLGLLTDYRLNKGMVLRLMLPEYWAGATIPVFAEVAWTCPLTDRFRAGLRFL